MKQILALIAALFLSISLAFAAVNVNTATEQQLETLNGIGPVKAKAIIDYRTKNGPFKSFDDIDNVPGIGKGTMAKIKKDVSLSGNTVVAVDAKGGDKNGKDSKSTTQARATKTATNSGKDDKAGDKTASTPAKKEQQAKSSAGKDDDAKKASGTADARDTKGRFAKKDEKKAEGVK